MTDIISIDSLQLFDIAADKAAAAETAAAIYVEYCEIVNDAANVVKQAKKDMAAAKAAAAKAAVKAKAAKATETDKAAAAAAAAAETAAAETLAKAETVLTSETAAAADIKERLETAAAAAKEAKQLFECSETIKVTAYHKDAKSGNLMQHETTISTNRYFVANVNNAVLDCLNNCKYETSNFIQFELNGNVSKFDFSNATDEIEKLQICFDAMIKLCEVFYNMKDVASNPLIVCSHFALRIALKNSFAKDVFNDIAFDTNKGIEFDAFKETVLTTLKAIKATRDIVKLKLSSNAKDAIIKAARDKKAERRKEVKAFIDEFQGINLLRLSETIAN